MAVKKDKEVYTIREAANFIGYSERQIRQKCINGEFSGAYKIAGGRKWLIPRTAVEQFSENVKRQEPTKLEVQRPASLKQAATSGQVSEDLLTQERRRKHQNNLLALVERLKGKLAQPLWKHPLRDLCGPGLHGDRKGLVWEVDNGAVYLRLLTAVTTNVEESVLRECLFQHLQSGGYNWLLERMNQCESVGGQELQERSKLLLALDEVMKRWLSSPHWTSVREAQGKTDPSFASTLVAALVDEVELDYPTVDEQKKPVYRSYCGGYQIGTATMLNAVRAYQIVHRNLATILKAGLQPEMPMTPPETQGVNMDSNLSRFLVADRERITLSIQQLRALLAQRGAICKEIEEGLVDMLLRAYTPGICRLCPEPNPALGCTKLSSVQSG